MIRLAKTLTVACAVQKQYGKTQAELETLVEGFSSLLAHRSTAAIVAGIEQYVRTHPDIPSPSDVEAIIDPPRPAWKPDWPVYVALKKRIHEGYFPLSDERQFLRDCENYAMEKRGAELASYEQAKLELTDHLRLTNVDGY